MEQIKKEKKTTHICNKLKEELDVKKIATRLIKLWNTLTKFSEGKIWRDKEILGRHILISVVIC